MTLCALIKSTIEFGMDDKELIMKRAQGLAIDSVYGV